MAHLGGVEKKHGEDEAKSRVKAGTIMARKDPKDPRFWQFLSETDSQQLSLDQQKCLKVQNLGQMKSDDAQRLVMSVKQQYEMADGEDFWNSEGVDLHGFDLKALQEKEDLNDEEDEPAEDAEPEPGSLEALLGGKQSKHKPTSSSSKDKEVCKTASAASVSTKNYDKLEKKLGTLSQCGDEETEAKAHRKLAAMHSFLSKQSLDLNVSVVAAKQKMKTKVPAKLANDVETVQQKMAKQLELLSKSVTQNFKVEAVKKVLLKAAAVSKEAHAVQQHVSELQKR